MTSFTPIFNQELEQGKLMAPLKFSGMKVQKNARYDVRIRSKFGKIYENVKTWILRIWS